MSEVALTLTAQGTSLEPWELAMFLSHSIPGGPLSKECVDDGYCILQMHLTSWINSMPFEDALLC